MQLSLPVVTTQHMMLMLARPALLACWLLAPAQRPAGPALVHAVRNFLVSGEGIQRQVINSKLIICVLTSRNHVQLSQQKDLQISG